jgi:hypothetical protein
MAPSARSVDWTNSETAISATMVATTAQYANPKLASNRVARLATVRNSVAETSEPMKTAAMPRATKLRPKFVSPLELYCGQNRSTATGKPKEKTSESVIARLMPNAKRPYSSGGISLARTTNIA